MAHISGPATLPLSSDSQISATPIFFQHAPLDHQTSSIRLIRILEPSSPDEQIQCEIRHSSINDTYTCLSYVWGERDAETLIKIGGHLSRIRQNLWDFLQSARLKAHLCQRWLWIDALCIDQTSIAERNHQVKLMGLIFSSAVLTISWLGMSEDLQACLRMESNLQDSFVASAILFYNSDYWDRAWITQEYALAREGVFMAGSEELGRVLDSRTYLNPHVLPNRMVDKARLRRINFERLPKGERRSIFYLLEVHGVKRCNIPRDRIFSLLALSIEGPHISVDYGISHSKLAHQVLRESRQSFCLCFLRIIRHNLPDGLDQDIHWLDQHIPWLNQDILPGEQRAVYLKLSEYDYTRWKGNTTIYIDLNDLCTQSWGKLIITTHLEESGFNDWYDRVGDDRYSRLHGCEFDYDWRTGQGIVFFSLEFLLEVADYIALDGPPSCCQRVASLGTTRSHEYRKGLLQLV